MTTTRRTTSSARSSVASTSNDFHTKATSYGKTLSEDLVKADAIVDEAARTAAYEKLNQQIMEEYLPGLPLSALAAGPGRRARGAGRRRQPADC